MKRVQQNASNIVIRRTWADKLADRMTEPLHVTALAGFVALFGSYRAKVKFDLIKRRHYAYGVLEAAEQARLHGHSSLTVVEFGVASGHGLLNLCKVAHKVSFITGVEINVIGFDSGAGMPPPCDYRDHPDLYQAGDFPMDQGTLRGRLPAYGKLVIGELKDTVRQFARTLNSASPIGFAAVDVDYYSSAKDAIALFADPEPAKYLPLTILYLDDINQPSHTRFAGEWLAVEEFNAAQPMRKIDRHHFLKYTRMFQNARWIEQIFLLHVFDHPIMRATQEQRPSKVYDPITPLTQSPAPPVS
ncbi:MAG: hypothetical protein ACREQ4_10185 [Candidatus Binataceae bacterium]